MKAILKTFFFSSLSLSFLLSIFQYPSHAAARLPRPAPGKFQNRWAVFHPFAALKLLKHKAFADSMYSSVKNTSVLDKYENGGQLDAYRHIFTMAFFSRYVAVRKLRKLGKAHEKDNYRQFLKACKEEQELPDSLGSVMDLLNNETGFTLFTFSRENHPRLLSEKVMQLIKAGKAIIMKRDAQGRYLDCNGHPLTETHFKIKSWSLPKCLVASDVK